MKKKGFTLIEIMISLSILSIIILMTFNFIFYNDRTYSRASKGIDESINLRIGLEFLVNEIATADSIKLVIIDTNGENHVNLINVSNSLNEPKVFLKITAGTEIDKIYILNNILRNDTLSQQIVCGIKSFSIENKGRDLYRITISTENTTLSTVVYRRK